MVLLVAHRGASFYEPENTLKSINLAFKMKCDYVEVDVRETKDGELVVIHDEKVDRTTNGRGLVKQLTLKEIKRLDAGGGEEIPTLQEVLGLAEKRRGKLIIELKEEGIEEKTVGMLRKQGFIEDAIIVSFYHPSVKKVKELELNIETGVIFSCFPVKPVNLAIDAKANYLLPKYKYLRREMVKDAHENGLKVITWVVNNPYLAKKLIKDNIDGLATNIPDLLSKT